MKPSFKPRARITGYSPQLHLQAKIRFKHSESIPTKKIFSTIFFILSFFTILVILAEKKTKSHEKNFTREKIFRLRDFGLKHVLKHSESIPTKIFGLCHFSLFWSFWLKNDYVPRKKNKSKLPIFWKFDLKNPIKSFHYFGHFGQKTKVPRKTSYTEKKFRFRDFGF